MSSNAGAPKVDDEGFVTPNPGQGHYKGSSGGGSTKVDAESSEVAAVAAASDKPDAGSEAAGGGGTLTADAMGGLAAKPGLQAAQGSNTGSGTSHTISSTTRKGPAQMQPPGRSDV
ncbi:hypothetical protein ABBQ32_008052 [Trebouxia sp. C0010 RCD-2024]